MIKYMKQEFYIVNDKKYHRDQLIAFGKEEKPKVFLIPRILGIIIFGFGVFIMGLIGMVMLILYFTGVFNEPEFPIWAFYIPLGVFGFIALIGLLCFIVSFIPHRENTYIRYAIRYMTKHDITLCDSDEERLLSPRDAEALKRNDRLLKGGVISKEEHDKRKEEIVG